MTESPEKSDITKTTKILENSLSRILENLSCALNEHELWALTNECMKRLSLLVAKELPEYISLDTLEVQHDGSVCFKDIDEHSTLDLLFIAPEAQLSGEINEKTCIYGIAVILWTTADYNIPENQEPALSDQFENLLISMTQNDATMRPNLKTVLKACENYYLQHDSSKSHIVCQNLLNDSIKINSFNKFNPTLADMISEEASNSARVNHALIINSIKNNDHSLKPADSRILAEKVIEKSSHELLMDAIKNSGNTLKKCRQPRLLKINAVYRSDKNLMKSLVNVTRPNSKIYQTPPLHRKLMNSRRRIDSFSSSSGDESRRDNSTHHHPPSTTPPPPSSLQVQLTRDLNTGLYSVLPFDLRMDGRRGGAGGGGHAKKRRSRGLQRTQSQNINSAYSATSTANSTSAYTYANAYGRMMSSNPNLNSQLSTNSNSDIYDSKPMVNRYKYDSFNSPPSPSWSKDSGISGVKNASNTTANTTANTTGNTSANTSSAVAANLASGSGLITSPLSVTSPSSRPVFSSEPQCYVQIDDTNQRISENKRIVIDLLRNNISMDRLDSRLGDLDENTMAEYIVSLSGLKWLTFMNALLEKYTDLYFTENFLISIYETINNRKNRRIDRHSVSGHRMHRSKDSNECRWSSSTNSSTPGSPAPQTNYYSSPASATPTSATPTSGTPTLDSSSLSHERHQTSAYSSNPRESSAFTPINHHGRVPRLRVVDCKPRPLSVHSPFQDVNNNNNRRLHHQHHHNHHHTSSSSSLSYRHQPSMPTHVNSSLLLAESSQHMPASNLCRSYSQMLTSDTINARSSIRRQQARNKSDLSTHSLRPISICTNSRKVETQPRLPTNGRVIYYHAEMLMSRKSAPISPDLDSETHELIEKKLKEIIQLLSIEQKNRRKTHRYYNKLLEITKQRKVGSEQKILLTSVSRQLNETNDKLFYLEASKKHLEMVHAEYWSIPIEILGSFIEVAGDPDEIMRLYSTDHHYRYFVFENNDNSPNSLQAATPVALMAYLFARSALSDGYIHKFFFVYRYLITSSQLLHFLITKYCSAEKSISAGKEDLCTRVKVRSLTLLQVWIESYFSIDFKDNFNLSATLKCFLRQHQIKDNRESLLELFERCENKINMNLYNKSQKNGEIIDNSNSNLNSSSSGNINSLPIANMSYQSQFHISNYSAHDLAKEILYSHQNLFQFLHPVNFLQSENRGFIIIDDNVVTENENFSSEKDEVLRAIIKHDHNISYWVSIEIVSCQTSKEQTQTIVKFIHTARVSSELRNYAGCVAILFGLQNIVIRQLPAWRNLPSKVKSIYENLLTLSNLLSNDVMYLTKDDETKNRSTIPCCNIFVQQIQNLENEDLLLVSGMYDWSKLCVISDAIDQIRHFQLRPYNVSSTCDNLWIRIKQVSSLDLISIASRNKQNVPKISSSRTFFQKIRSKFN